MTQRKDAKNYPNEIATCPHETTRNYNATKYRAEKSTGAYKICDECGQRWNKKESGTWVVISPRASSKDSKSGSRPPPQ